MSQTLQRSPWTPQLYVRAVAGAALPGFLWGGGDRLPQGSLRLEGVDFSDQRIRDYRRVCGEGPGLPPAMLHLPGFPLALQLMTARDFPMSALGMVHIANTIEVLTHLETSDEYDITVELANPRTHRKGAQFDAVTTATRDDVVVWREVSTYLSRGTRLADAPAAPPQREWPSASADAEQIAIDVPGDIGRRYAAVSGDRNPIHLHGLAARVFGFRTAIAHGMWSLARCLSEVESELPERYTVVAGFFKPVFLPAKTTLFIDRGAGEWSLLLSTGTTRHAALHIRARE